MKISHARADRLVGRQLAGNITAKFISSRTEHRRRRRRRRRRRLLYYWR